MLVKLVSGRSFSQFLVLCLNIFFICIKHSLNNSFNFCYVFGGCISVGQCIFVLFWEDSIAINCFGKIQVTLRRCFFWCEQS